MTQGHHAFDHALQEANIWLKSAEKHLHCSEHEAYQALRVTLQALRDSLPLENAVKLAAQFPTLIRGVYYEGWHLAAQQASGRSDEAFSHHIRQSLPERFPMDGRTVAKGIFEVLWERLDPGETAKIIHLMPADLRHLWPAIAIRQ